MPNPPIAKPCHRCGKESVVVLDTASKPARFYRTEKGQPVCGECEGKDQPYWEGRVVFLGKPDGEMYEVC